MSADPPVDIRIVPYPINGGGIGFTVFFLKDGEALSVCWADGMVELKDYDASLGLHFALLPVDKAARLHALLGDALKVARENPPAPIEPDNRDEAFLINQARADGEALVVAALAHAGARVGDIVSRGYSEDTPRFWLITEGGCFEEVPYDSRVWVSTASGEIALAHDGQYFQRVPIDEAAAELFPGMLFRVCPDQPED